jgi:hypothetical protein
VTLCRPPPTESRRLCLIPGVLSSFPSSQSTGSAVLGEVLLLVCSLLLSTWGSFSAASLRDHASTPSTRSSSSCADVMLMLRHACVMCCLYSNLIARSESNVVSWCT